MFKQRMMIVNLLDNYDIDLGANISHLQSHRELENLFRGHQWDLAECTLWYTLGMVQVVRVMGFEMREGFTARCACVLVILIVKPGGVEVIDILYYILLIPCRKFRLPYLGKATAAATAVLRGPTVHAGSFRVSIIHRTLTWTTGSLISLCDNSYARTYTWGLGTLTTSQHNIFHSEKLIKISTCFWLVSLSHISWQCFLSDWATLQLLFGDE